MQAYRVIRFYASGKKRTIFPSVSLEIAQLHCRSAKTKKVNSKGVVIWFDGYKQLK